MALLNAQTILSARDLKTITVPCPEWGGEVLIGEMGAMGTARLWDWLDSKQSPQKKIEESSEDQEAEDDRIKVVTTDSPGGEPEYLDEEDEKESLDIEELEETESIEPTEPPKVSLSLKDNVEFHCRYLIESILDPDTFQPAFQLSQIEALGRKNPKVIRRLFDQAQAFHQEVVGDQETFEKNSTTAAVSGGG